MEKVNKTSEKSPSKLLTKDGQTAPKTKKARKAPPKKPPLPPPPPPEGHDGKPREMIPFPRETHKLEPEGVKYLIDLTLAGYSVAEIIKAIKDAYGVAITDQGVFYHRRVHRKSLMVGITEDIAAARAVYPEAALLVGRLGNLDKALKKEMAKKKVSGYAVAALVAEQTNAMHKAETLQLRLMEFEKRYPTGKDDEAERVLRELERRSHVLRNVTEEVETIQKIAGGDFEPDAIPVEAEVVQGGAEDPPAEKTLAAELDAEELGEDALTT